MSVWPAWEVQDHESAVSWFGVRLDFPDGGQVDVLAVVAAGCVAIEEVRAQPPLSLDDLAALADWIEEPLLEACGAAPEPSHEPAPAPAPRADPDWPGGLEGWRLVAQEYLAAQRQGIDPVSAVMRMTGCSRRTSLKLIGGARDIGLLTPRHAQR
ncbi:DUF6214 family protein [Streptomyces yaanensis]|uniref:DUF6214 family protein n=1 Tax=Streptomyces yaanensis TaxID=1142239 RepID=A0ABV7S542_9ACTN|nr:DUF6214 family protein [Streptomyces sp. CGMCC 4.7035]WNB99490.1 DUF6214 family protein [Streptomyces sp. CGMCC 4.7035]